MTYKVVQWATGSVGMWSLKEIVRNPDVPGICAVDAPAPGHGMPVTQAVALPEPEPLGVHAILKTLGRGAVCAVTTEESPKS